MTHDVRSARDSGGRGLLSCLLRLVGMVGCLLAAVPAAAEQRPNIVYIFSDDHAVQAISAYDRGRLIKTPGIDRIASEGVLFTNSFCGNSICGPSRATVLTSVHTHINGFTGNGNTFDGSQTTLPKLLREAGYQTAIIGKWHLGSEPTGFDHWDILPGQGWYVNPEFITPEGTTRFEGHATDIISEKTLTWLREQRDPNRPFLLMCQHKAPHRNWTPAERHYRLFEDVDIPEPASLFTDHAGVTEWAAKAQMRIAGDMYWSHDLKLPGKSRSAAIPQRWRNGEFDRMTASQRARFDEVYGPRNRAFIDGLEAGRLSDRDVTRWVYQRYIKDYLRCIAGVDESVSAILDELDRLGLAENTIVVYSSDQGFYLGERGWFDKRWMFEESMRMPLVMRWPGVIPAGGRADALVQNIDHAPTLLEAAGVEVPERMQGRSLMPIARDRGRAPEGWRDDVYYAYYMYPSVHYVAIHDGVRTADHKLMWFPQTHEWQLFDLAADPDETTSVHDDPAYRGVLTEMKRRYHAARARYLVDDAELIGSILAAPK